MSDKKNELVQEYFKFDPAGMMYSELDVHKINRDKPYQCVECGYFDFDRNSVCPSCGADLTETKVDQYFDPIEKSEEYKKVEKEIEEVLKGRFPESKRRRGTCHDIWRTQDYLLRKKGILWRSPAVMNPGIWFD